LTTAKHRTKYAAMLNPPETLPERLAKAIDALRLTRFRASSEAEVSQDTLRKALDGGDLRPTTRKRLERWLLRAEKRLERRGPRL
jgi:hypothetical protein